MSAEDRANNSNRVVFDAYGPRGGYRTSMVHTGPETTEAMESFVKDPKYSRVTASGKGLPKTTTPNKRKYN